MKLLPGLREHGFALVGVLSGVVAFGTPSIAEAVFPCLPSPACRGVADCCKPARKELYLQIARAEMRRDFYKSAENRDAAFKKGAWDSGHTLDAAFNAYIASDAAAARLTSIGLKPGAYADVPTLITGDDCKTKIESTGDAVKMGDVPGIFDNPDHPLTKPDVCKEAVAAAVRHEVEHQDRCEAKKAGYIKPKPGVGWARQELEDHADDEQNAYAAEADTLRRYARQAKRRCTTAKALADDAFDNAKQKTKALREMAQPRSW